MCILKTDFSTDFNKKFIVSIPGLLKIFAILCYLVSCIMFLCTPACLGTPAWYAMLYPVSAATSGVSVGISHAILALGIVKTSGCVNWEIVDFIFNVSDFVYMLPVSILTTIACDNKANSAHRLSTPIGIVGAFLLVTSSTIWAVRTRSSRDVNLPVEGQQETTTTQYRKSFIA